MVLIVEVVEVDSVVVLLFSHWVFKKSLLSMLYCGFHRIKCPVLVDTSEIRSVFLEASLPTRHEFKKPATIQPLTTVQYVSDESIAYVKVSFHYPVT